MSQWGPPLAITCNPGVIKVLPHVSGAAFEELSLYGIIDSVMLTGVRGMETEDALEIARKIEDLYKGLPFSAWPSHHQIPLEIIMTSRQKEEPKTNPYPGSECKLSSEVELDNTPHFKGEPEPVALEQSKSKFDEINKAAQYNQHPSGVEAKHVLRLMSFNYGTALKYVLRAGLKPGNPTIKDLKKAEFYLKDEQENCSSELVGWRAKRVGDFLIQKICKAEPDNVKRGVIESIWGASCSADPVWMVDAQARLHAMLERLEKTSSESSLMEHAP